MQATDFSKVKIRPETIITLSEPQEEHFSSVKINPSSIRAIPRDNNQTPDSNPLLAAERSFTKSATAGLSEPIAAAGSTVIEKLFPNEAQAQLNKGKTIGQIYDENREDLRQSAKEQEEGSPIASAVGDIAGFMAPGGAFNRLEKGAKAILPATKLVQGTKALSRAEKLNPFAKAGLRGAGATAAYEGINPDQEINPVDVAVGGIAEPASEALKILAIKASGAGKNAARGLMNRALGVTPAEIKAGKDLGREALERGLKGTNKSLLQKAEAGIEVSEDALQKALDDAGKIKRKPNRVYTPDSKASYYSSGEEQLKNDPFKIKKIITETPISNSREVAKEINPTITIKQEKLFPFLPDNMVVENEIQNPLSLVPESLLPREERGFTGTIKNILNNEEKYPNHFSVKVKNVAPLPNNKIINKKTLIDNLEKTKEILKGGELNDSHIATIDELIGKIKSDPKYQDLTPSKANEIKRAIYKQIGDRAYLLNNPPEKKAILKSLASGLRESIEKTTPEAKALNEEIGFNARLKKKIVDKMAKQEAKGPFNVGRIVKDTIAGGIGAALLGPAGGLGATVLREAGGGTLGQTVSAHALNNLSKKLEEKANLVKLLSSMSVGTANNINQKVEPSEDDKKISVRKLMKKGNQ